LVSKPIDRDDCTAAGTPVSAENAVSSLRCSARKARPPLMRASVMKIGR
jgi:hypothetical protein